MEKQNRKENDPKEFRGKAYTLYEAKQRQMETAMRAQCEKIRLLQHGGADPDEVMLQKAKYQGQLNEYAAFSRKREFISMGEEGLQKIQRFRIRCSRQK